MKLHITDFMSDRIEEIAANLRKTNGEYALAVQARKDLTEKLDPIVMSQEELRLSVGDLVDMREYMQHEFTIAAIEQQTFYKQGYLDCVDLLQGLGVL